MTTTALRIELLIIGFQASIWGVFLFGLSPSEIIEAVEKLKDIAVVLSVILLCWCYSFGAAIDALTGAIEDPKSLFLSDQNPHLRSSILSLKYPEASKELLQNYFALRLLRSTAFNLSIYSGVSIYAGHPFSITVATFLSSIVVGLSWWRRKKRIHSRRNNLCDKTNELETNELA